MKIIKYGGLLGVFIFCISGCSSLSFTRGEKPFDGTVHATSSLICSGYWSNHGYDGKNKGRTFSQRILPTAGLAIYSTVDLASSIFADTILFPVHLAGGGPGVAAFDKVPHRLIPCGSIEHSINTVGAL